MERCQRCGGAMVVSVPLASFTGELEEEPAMGCVNCGEYVDRTILANRAAQAAAAALAVAA